MGGVAWIWIPPPSLTGDALGFADVAAGEGAAVLLAKKLERESCPELLLAFLTGAALAKGWGGFALVSKKRLAARSALPFDLFSSTDASLAVTPVAAIRS